MRAMLCAMPLSDYDPETGTKTCTKCGRRLTLDKFVKFKHKPLGVGAQCKRCRSEWFNGYRKQWRRDQGRRSERSVLLEDALAHMQSQKVS